MSARAAFVLGVLVGKTLLDIAGALAQTDTEIGKEVRRRLYARRSLDHLLRAEVEIGAEVTRRLKTERDTPVRG